MKIIIPMAGMGKRMRPHTLTVPKPLIPIAGKPIVHRIVEDIAQVCPEPIESVHFVIARHFGPEIEQSLIDIAGKVNAEGHIYYQDNALGTAHAVYCAEAAMEGPVIVAFADTLFRADFELNTKEDGIIWVQRVKDPSAYGVVQVNAYNTITGFIEKPQTPVSDLAIIGIYYFKKGESLRAELKHLIDQEIMVKGEYQLTDALDNMRNKGTSFKPGEVQEWLDCGNKDAAVYANQRYLEYIKDQDLISPTLNKENSIIIPPVYIGENVNIKNAIIGPHVSVGEKSQINNSIIRNSIIQNETVIRDANIQNSMVGSHAEYKGTSRDLNLGDYNVLKE